jgi:uncharacterized protein (UPF0332 family)
MTNPLKPFNDFIKDGIVRKQLPDKERAKFLIGEAENSYNSLLDMVKKVGINNINANTFVKNAYDPMMELVRAILLIKGFNSSGSYAHEAEVAYLKELDFSEADVQFANQLRYFRNGVMYYGTILKADYANKVITFVKKIYPILKSLAI